MRLKSKIKAFKAFFFQPCELKEMYIVMCTQNVAGTKSLKTSMKSNIHVTNHFAKVHFEHFENHVTMYSRTKLLFEILGTDS